MSAMVFVCFDNGSNCFSFFNNTIHFLAISLAAADSEVFVIGGAQIYELALPRADRLYVTHVEAEVDGDTFFPPIDWTQWRLLEQTVHEADTKNEFPTRFCIYDRIH